MTQTGLKRRAIADDTTRMARRHIRRTLLALGVAIAAPAVAVSSASASTWASASVQAVVAAQLLPDTTVDTFGPDRPLDHATLALLVWGSVPGSIATTDLPLDGEPATIGELDAAFVQAYGLSSAAQAAHDGLVAAGYLPRDDAGTEIVARLLSLRYNHPAADDALELADFEIATRAEAAYTTAVALGGVDRTSVARVVARIASLPQTTGERHRVIDRAVGLIGRPYVWGGTWDDTTGGPAGFQLHGGYDCSGLVWRTMAYAPGASRAAGRRLGGRTTYDMASTTAKARKLPPSRVRPGDVLLFSPRGRKARWQEVDHSAIAIGNGLMIQSSNEGVTLTVWAYGHYAHTFAFGKSVLSG